MSEAADRAYELAREEIKRVKTAGMDTLAFDSGIYLALERLPPEISELTTVRRLILSDTNLTELAPISTLADLESLAFDRTPISNIEAIESLNSLTSLNLKKTRARNLEPLSKLTKLEHINLSNTQIEDIYPLTHLPKLKSLTLDATQITDLRPVVYFRDLGKPIEKYAHNGFTFKQAAATRMDSKLLQLSNLRDHVERTEKTLAYLRSLPPWPEPYTPAARPDGQPPQPIGGPSIPAPSPAPLEVEERDGQLRQVPPSDGLAPAERDPAREGWEALFEALEDLSHLRPRLGNHMPGMARALIRFEAALGAAYEEVRPIKLGAAGNRVMALAETAEENLQPADAAELRELALAIAVFMERFPAWISYRDAVRAAPPDAAKVAEAMPLLEEVAERLRDQDAIHEEIPKSLALQRETVKDAPKDPVAAEGLLRSERNVLLALAERVKGARGLVRSAGKLVVDEGKKMAAKGVVLAGLGLFAAAATQLGRLAVILPEYFGWLGPVLRFFGL